MQNALSQCSHFNLLSAKLSNFYTDVRFLLSYAYDWPIWDENNDGSNYRCNGRFWILVLIILAENALYLKVILEISVLFLELKLIIEV